MIFKVGQIIKYKEGYDMGVMKGFCVPFDKGIILSTYDFARTDKKRVITTARYLNQDTNIIERGPAPLVTILESVYE